MDGEPHREADTHRSDAKAEQWLPLGTEGSPPGGASRLRPPRCSRTPGGVGMGRRKRASRLREARPERGEGALTWRRREIEPRRDEAAPALGGVVEMLRRLASSPGADKPQAVLQGETTKEKWSFFRLLRLCSFF